MSAKTIFIIIIAVLVTIILMKNTDEVDFWIFGDMNVSKLAIFGVMFGLGLIAGFLVGRPRKKTTAFTDGHPDTDVKYSDKKNDDNLSDEDRDYIR